MLTTIRQTVRRLRHAHAIRAGTFGDLHDPMFRNLPLWVSGGDVAVDVGAAVGTYTLPLSGMVGPDGRVVAIEPAPEQFDTLASNAARAPFTNITCLQLAAGDTVGACRLSAPVTGVVHNWYEAHITEDGSGFPVLRATLDALPLPRPLALLKVDAEGQDFQVLRGAERIIREDHPVIYTEGGTQTMADWLEGCGYDRVAFDFGSANQVFLCAHHRSPAGVTVVPLQGIDVKMLLAARA